MISDDTRDTMAHAMDPTIDTTTDTHGAVSKAHGAMARGENDGFARQQRVIGIPRMAREGHNTLHAGKSLHTCNAFGVMW